MKFKSLLLLICIYLIHLNVKSQKIEIGLFQHLETSKLFIESPKGKYKIKSGGKTIYRLKKDRSIIINFTKGYLNVSNSKKDFGLHQNIEFVSKKYKFNKIHDKISPTKASEVVIKLITPKQNARVYQGNLRIFVNNKKLEAVNQLSMSDYLAGVVEAESGSNEVPEYYKNQAVICRTYAFQNSKKHEAAGFNLCDGVHCQAYKGKSTLNPIIQKAVKQTENLVIVDKDNELVSAVFSANCGGQTNNSEDVWVTALPYLKSIVDTFCINQRQANWTKNISLNDWKNFLKENSINIPDTLSNDSFVFNQEKRLKYYNINGQQIRLTTLRYGLKLRSTFFSIQPEGSQLKLSGKGYGHGVGMCQEGAMNMAKKGYKFDEIIKFYYSGVKITPCQKQKWPL